MRGLKSLMSSLLISLVALSLASCSSSSESDKDTSVHTGNGQPNMAPILALTPAPQTATNNLTFKYSAVIRELGDTDKAAMFVILPNQGSIQVTDVSRPRFLGKPRIGQLDQESINALFLNGSVAMSQQEKDNLLSEYKGAGIVYFEKYDGALCSGDEITVTVSSSLGDLKLNTSFVFTAEQSPNGECKFSPRSILTSYFN